MKGTIIALGAVVLTVMSASALPAADKEPKSVEIQYADLDLENPKGVATLEKRIERASRLICADSTPTTGSRLDTAKSRRCVAEARESARKSLAAIMQSARKGG